MSSESWVQMDNVNEAPDVAQTAVEIRAVSKCYQIYAKPFDRLKQSLLTPVRRRLGGHQEKYFTEFWALREVSAVIPKGATMGIIGRNGSGKSTLLQIISGTLSASTGEVTVNGKVAALLELGAGFNPEFTGRENVYMNAAIYGLTNEQVTERFQSITEFAGIGQFMDQPVKTYSSGMYVRLAFAVIAHVDADILIIDEALSVGDAIFQQKCMRFLRRFRENGTLIFVSHETSSVLNMCETAIWLDGGSVRKQGSAQDVVNAYLEYTAQEIYGDAVRVEKLEAAGQPAVEALPEDEAPVMSLFDNIAHSEGWKTGSAEILSVEVMDQHGVTIDSLKGGERVQIRIVAKAHSDLESPILGFFVKDKLGQSLFGEHTYTYAPQKFAAADSTLVALFEFTMPLLPNGAYSVTASVADGDPWTNVQHHWVHDAVIIHVASQKLRYGLVGIPFHAAKLIVEARDD